MEISAPKILEDLVAPATRAEAQKCQLKQFLFIAWLLLAALSTFANAEVAVSVNGVRTWKVLGPDINGRYGGMHGVGGLEATVQKADGATVPVLNDYFGNVLATIASSSATWSPIRLGAYGPVMGYRPATLAPGAVLAETLVWRSRWMDPSGLYCLGARYYDPMGGHFLSPDPLGHEASMDLHSFCNGDPLNSFDPTGCFGKSVNDFLGSGVSQMQDQIGALTDQYYSENGYGHSPNGDEMISGFYNALPLIGAAKMMIELGTGSDLVTGRTIEGSGVGQAAGILFNVLGVALPMMEVGAGAIGAGSELAAGSMGTESIVADTELAANTTATQMEFNFVNEDLSGQLAASGSRDIEVTATPYGELRDSLPDGFQANHLNQNAAFSSVIPRNEGLASAMQGNAFTEPGTPHYDFHQSLEGFWDQYRPGGELFGQVPSNAEYGQALQQALQVGGYSPGQAASLASQAAEQRASYGLSEIDPVPRIPGRINQAQP